MVLSRSGRRMSSLKGRAKHLRMLAQIPDIRLIARQAGAVDAGLLASAHADDLAVLCIADGVGLGIFQGNQGNQQVALSLLPGNLLLSVTTLESMASSIFSSLRPCSKVTPYTSLCSTGAGS